MGVIRKEARFSWLERLRCRLRVEKLDLRDLFELRKVTEPVEISYQIVSYKREIMGKSEDWGSHLYYKIRVDGRDFFGYGWFAPLFNSHSRRLALHSLDSLENIIDMPNFYDMKNLGVI